MFVFVFGTVHCLCFCFWVAYGLLFIMCDLHIKKKEYRPGSFVFGYVYYKILTLTATATAVIAIAIAIAISKGYREFSSESSACCWYWYIATPRHTATWCLWLV